MTDHNNSETTSKPYTLAWESLQQHPDPQWFDDGKFGIYFHWGPYSVPAFDNEWYSRNMYLEGHVAHEHHKSTYGPLSQFSYKEFIPMFTGEHFDADEWSDLFKRSGAKFAGPVAEHADGFAMWDTKYSPYHSVAMGPKRNIVAEMEKAVRKHGMKYITTFHHMWLWAWFPTFNKELDTSDPANAGLYGPFTEPGAFDEPQPDDAFCDLFINKIKEVVDAYEPDLLWFDARMDTISEKHRQDFVAHYYNQAEKWGREVGITYKNEDLAAGSGILDVERGRMSGLRPFKWLTDDSICWKSWANLHEPEYKSVKRLVDSLVDIVSKNGNLLLNIPPEANGRIPDPVRERLLGIGEWLKVNGEGIYGTRPFHTFGEGPTQVQEGHFSEKENADFTAADIRYTTKDKTIYAICMGWPTNEITLKSIQPQIVAPAQITSVELLGAADQLMWKLDDTGLTISPPNTRPSEHAITFKINLA
ncbi:MAG: alpha-L-fucosidase [Chloroflexi bacterium]|nr:MAG: alpha-L-fucosidase [Chloroflexota bacterium]